MFGKPRVQGEPVSYQTRHKKWTVGESGTETGEQLALNYRVNQERSCKEVKGLATPDYW